MSDLIGKVVLITGSSRGIGSSIAKELAHKGASVIINFSQDNVGAEKTLEEIQLNGGYAKIIKKDISNSVNCKELIEEVISIFGKIDVLINNAAKSQVGLFMDFTEEDIEGLINTNLLSAMYLSKYALPYMISKNYGNIINISSIWGEVGASCEVVYSTTKGGLNLFTKSLAKEVAPFNIRVNSIAPGVINTEMNSFLSEEEKQNLIDEIPMNRFGDVSEIAKAVAFLCSDDSKYLTGQIIKIDGAFI
ncbi:MAG: SDR family oxidoreductase [Clostridium celatum]|nr:SDR family oxidoreductase [Clostridium celatum]